MPNYAPTDICHSTTPFPNESFEKIQLTGDFDDSSEGKVFIGLINYYPL